MSRQSLLEAGDLLIERGEGIWGFGAKLVFGSDYQHACMVTHDTSHVIEAIWNGVGINPLDTSRNLEQYEIWRPACSASQRSRAVYKAMSRTGEAYGYAQLLLAALRRNVGLLGLPGLPGLQGLPAPDVPGMWCSELISWAYDQVGYDLHLELDAHRTGPWDLRNPLRLERVA